MLQPKAGYNTIKNTVQNKKYTTLNKIHKYYDTTSAVVSMADSSVCDND